MNSSLNSSSNQQILKFLNSDYIVTEQWFDLFTHFILLDEPKVMPTKEWYTETQSYINTIGEDNFKEIGFNWIKDCIEKSKEKQWNYNRLNIAASYRPIEKNLGFDEKNTPEWVRKVYGEEAIKNGFFITKSNKSVTQAQNYFYQSLGGRILRGFLHCSIILDDSYLLTLVDQMALSDPTGSHDAIHIYTKISPKLGIPRLGMLKTKTKNRNILKRIDKAIAVVGKKSGATSAEIQESIVPDHKLSRSGKLVEKIGGINVTFHLQNNRESSITYHISNDKQQKTAPKKIREEYGHDLKRFKTRIKEVKEALNIHKRRLEEFYLISRSIPYNSFVDHYLNNNLVKILARDLIWRFQVSGQNIDLFCRNGSFVDRNNTIYSGDFSASTVSLWHPILSTDEEVEEWRSFILNHEIVQPFKQAFREVYALTDAERTTAYYSNRYSAHILYKDMLAGLCKTRKWSTSGLIQHEKVSFKIPKSDYKVDYLVEETYLGERSKIYGSAHVTSGRVLFYNKKRTALLSEIPNIQFSEIMRDIDLFVGVASIGNNPDWLNRPPEEIPRQYIHRYESAELTERAKTRVEIIKNLIPKMSIANKCEFDGKFLKVFGNLGKYRINMNSGSVHMEFTNRHICIVPAKSSSKLKQYFIPFEGDAMLSIILSKAILLVDDHKITDPVIIRQINRQ